MFYDAEKYAEARLEVETLTRAIRQHGRSWNETATEDATERLGKALYEMAQAAIVLTADHYITDEDPCNVVVCNGCGYAGIGTVSKICDCPCHEEKT